MMDLSSELDQINFGDIPGEVNGLLQQGVMAYRHDRARADRLFRQALATAPSQLPVYSRLYKSHTQQRNLAKAEAATAPGWV